MPPKHFISPQSSKKPAALDYAFWKKINNLTVAIKNLVERNAPDNILKIPGWHPFLLVATRTTQFIYESISYLSADSPPDPLRKLEFGICTSPLIRSLVDLLFTIIFISEQPQSRIKRYHQAGWRETKKILEILENRYEGNPIWKEKFIVRNAALENLRIAYQISKKRAKKSNDLPRWPIPSKILREEKLGVRTKQFLEYLNVWYTELSQDHHLSGGGIIRVYSKFLLMP
jgi:hypothetical protein